MSTLVLIHGAWHGSWTWTKVAEHIRRLGHTVHTPDLTGHGRSRVQIAQVTLDAYADCITDVIDGCTEPVVLVGHSMGGIAISQAAERRSHSIQALVYVCGFLLRNGQTLLQVAENDADAIVLRNLVMADDHRSATLQPAAIREMFYGDCAPEDAKWAQSQLIPQATAPFGTAVQLSDAKFGKIPRFYVECLQDRAITHRVQREMYTATPCKQVFTLNASHSPFLSQARELGELLVRIAAS